MNTNSLVRSLATLLVIGASLSGCTTGALEAPLTTTGAEPESALVAVPEDPEAERNEHGTGQTLRIGIPFDYPGIGLMNKSTGIPSGFTADIAAYLAWKLGYSPYDIVWIEATTAERVQLLQSGDVDFVVTPMSITPERAAEVDFAGPYLLAGQDVLVRAGDTSIQSKEDLAGRTLCAPPDTTGEDRIREILGDEVTFIYEDSYELCIRDVVDGKADAVTTDDVILAGQAATDEFYRAVRTLQQPFSEERYGIGLPKGSRSLCLQINQALTEMVEDGSWAKFINRNVAGTHYFADLYENPPALDACQ